MYRTLVNSWPLFFGLAMLMIGNGLQGTLLGVRASLEQFNVTAIGMIMSCYYIGYMLGSYVVPKMVVRVGHIRVFAALASLASTTVLVNGLFADPYVWGAVRIVSGFGFAGLFIVIESWLNNVTTNRIRGQVLALYLIVLYGGMTVGQFLLTLADPQGMELFVLTSVLVSLALLPVSLSSRPAPAFSEPERVSLAHLYKTSPLGVIGVTFSGMTTATAMAVGAVYAQHAGFSLSQTSSFMAAFITGGVLFQIPIGWASDRYDRRRVLIAVTFLSACFALLAMAMASYSFIGLLAAMCCLGGGTLSLYALGLAHTNDHLQPNQTVAAGATMMMMNGLGSCFGPLAASALIDHFGPPSFFVMLASVFVFVTLFGLYRITRRRPVPLEAQGPFMPIPARSSPIAIQIAAESSETLKKMEK